VFSYCMLLIATFSDPNAQPHLFARCRGAVRAAGCPARAASGMMF
jgi:hypothetical protein